MESESREGSYALRGPAMMTKMDGHHWIYDAQMALVTLVIALLLFGCSKPSVDPPIAAQEPEFEAPKSPRLLPKVELKSSLPQLKNEDGTGRVDGYMVRLKKHLDSTVGIAGTVIYKSSTKWQKKRRTLPHLYVADENDPEADLKLLVVRLDEKQMRKIKKGKRYIFKGKLVQRLDELGWENERGMIALDSFETLK